MFALFADVGRSAGLNLAGTYFHVKHQAARYRREKEALLRHPPFHDWVVGNPDLENFGGTKGGSVAS